MRAIWHLLPHALNRFASSRRDPLHRLCGRNTIGEEGKQSGFGAHFAMHKVSLWNFLQRCHLLFNAGCKVQIFEGTLRRPVSILMILIERDYKSAARARLE
jgi:hypothetical protein